MENKDEDKIADNFLGDLPIQSESIKFAQEELIMCKNCERTNPPTRLDCIYCGKELELDQANSKFLKPILRKTDPEKNGCNLMLKSTGNDLSVEQIDVIIKMTRLDKSILSKIFKSQKFLPIARTESEKEIAIAAERLKEIGLETIIFKDEAFATKTPNTRLRGLTFEDDKLILYSFNGNEKFEIEKENIRLIVIGALFKRKLETTESIKKKENNKVLDAAEISSDELVLDIYEKDQLIGYRILPKGFDFSFLGDMKKLVASQNIKLLISKLENFATNARIDEDYLQIRECLTDIWDVEEKVDHKGIKRKSFGSFNKINVTTTSNLKQFTKYSRLQQLLQDK